MRSITCLNKKISRFATRLICNFVILFLGITLSLQLHATSDITSSTDEYRVKAAFIYNFIAFTQWPESTDHSINLCIYGKDYFGHEIDLLQSRPVNEFVINVSQLTALEEARNCQVLFISKSEADHLSSTLGSLQGQAILTIADSVNAASKGVIINMNLIENKVKFEVNLQSARQVELGISARLLQLATKVYQ